LNQLLVKDDYLKITILTLDVPFVILLIHKKRNYLFFYLLAGAIVGHADGRPVALLLYYGNMERRNISMHIGN